jgi:hypothetical protein
MEQVALAEVYGKAIEKGQRQQVRGILSDVVPGLLDITLLTELGQPLLYLEYKDHALPVAVAGEGIQTLLRLCLELASRPDGVVLLEEPEVHLHPGAILQSARAILAAVRRGIQVFISTHSLELIDTLLAETNDEAEREKISVFGLKLDGGCLKSYRLSGPQASLMRTQIEDDLR